jgi:hypothetical protein
MHAITIHVKDDKLAEQVLWLLEHFKNDGVEILSIKDSDDLKALQATRNEASCSFEEYLANAH